MRYPRRELFRLLFSASIARFSSESLPSERIRKTLDRLYGSKMIVGNQGVVAEEIRRRAKQLGMQLIMVSPNANRFQAEEWRRDFSAFYKVSFQETEAGWAELENILRAISLLSPQNRMTFFDPGYGFISENARAPKVCEAAGVTFVGPSSEALAACGNKETAKKIFQQAEVPVIPAYSVSLRETLDSLRKGAAQLGYPIMVKKRHSGGGRGNVLAVNFENVCAILEKFKSEGECAPLLEKFLAAPRHLEKQVIFGPDGFIVWPNERDCSTQRRNAKIIEQTPACIQTPTRETLHDYALRLADQLWRNYNYVNSSLTIEYLARLGLEMNPRLQVEHGVTDRISGVDTIILRWLLAAGATLGDSLDYFLEQRNEDWRKFQTLQSKADRLMKTGPHAHAVEFRLNGVKIGKEGRQESVSGMILQSPQSDSDSTGECNVGYKAGDYFSSHDATPLLATVIGTGPTLIEAYANAYRRFIAAASMYQACFNVSSLEEFKACQEDPAIPLHIGRLPTNLLDVARILCHEDFYLLTETTPLPDALVLYKKNNIKNYATFFPMPTTQTTADVDKNMNMMLHSDEIRSLEKELASSEEDAANQLRKAQERALPFRFWQAEKAQGEARRKENIEALRSFFKENPNWINAPDEERIPWMGLR